MSLEDLGVTQAGIRLYGTLLDAPDSPGSELALLARLDQLRLDAEFGALVELGLIRKDDSTCSGYAVPHPSLTVNRLVERLEDDLMLRFRRVSMVRSEIGRLEAQFAAGQGKRELQDSGIERVEGLDAIRERIDELTFFTRSSVLSIQPGGPQSRESLEASRPLDLRMSRRNVGIRLIHQTAVLDDELNRVYLHELVMLGAEVRVTDQPVDRLLVLDGTVAIVPVEPGNSRRGALIVRQQALIVGLVELFDRIWESADELPWNEDGSVETKHVEAISDEDRSILNMLSSGSTDETVARQLGLSVRHLRRTISRLMTDLGAKSRFEAGAEAQRRGWL